MQILLLKSGLWNWNFYRYKKEKETKLLLPHQFITGMYLRQKTSHLTVRTSAPALHRSDDLAPQSAGKLTKQRVTRSSLWLRNGTVCVHCTLSLESMAISEKVTAVDYNSLREFHAFRNYCQNSGNFETGE